MIAVFIFTSLYEGGSYLTILLLYSSLIADASHYPVDTFIGGYRGHGNQKACLFMDRYVAEAEIVIEQEKQLHVEQYAAMSPAAPTPLQLDIQGYKEYVGSKAGINGSAGLMAATEEAFQYLLKKSYVNLSAEESQQRLLAEINSKNQQVAAFESSLSWRLTKPLRSIVDRLRAQG